MSQATSGTATQRPGGRRGHKGLIALAVIALLIILLILVWSWDWFIPIVDGQASAVLGRQVTIQHLHVRLGSTVRVVADDVAVAGTDAFPKPLAKVDHLTVRLELLPLIRHFAIVVPLVDVDHPVIDAASDRAGANNWTLGSPAQSKPSTGGGGPQLGVLRIEDGHVHVEDAKLRANFAVVISTRNTPDPDERPLPSNQGQIVAEANGTYAGQPITGHFVGGAVLSLRDKRRPYPIDLTVANGPTHVTLVGTLEQPLTFGGARLRLVFAGPDMSLLFPLTAVPIPQTPPYQVEGNLDYSRDHIEFRNFHGRVGSSDLNGTIRVVPTKVPTINADLFSRNVNLADLGGFVGSTPGKAKTDTAAQKVQVAQANASGDVLPTNTFNVPKIRAATVHLSYKGDHIENPNLPLDNIVARLDIENGDIDLKRLDFKVGTGTLYSSVSLNSSGDSFRTKGHVDFHNIDLSRVLHATHTFKGQGIIGGRADINTNGRSIAQMLGNGDGGLTLIMSGGGDVSALLPDIAGLEFGNALLSALGVPNRSPVQCFVADMPLRNGILSTDVFLLQTSEARTIGRGTIDFRNQTADYSLTTRSTRFSIGSLPGPINITGKLGKPSILPGTEVVARASGAVALGVLFPPLGLLPTIQLGVGKGSACQQALTTVDAHPAAGRIPRANGHHAG